MVRVGAITVGQAPRDDVVPELTHELGPDVRFVQCGALDDLNLDQVRAHPPVCGESTLVSRMRDGAEVRVERSFVIPRMQASIRAIEEDVCLIIVLCTAPFEEFESKVPLLLPARILERTVEQRAVTRLGVVTPSPDQAQMQSDRWEDFVRDEVFVEAVSPYTGTKGLEVAAARLLHRDVDFVVLDCIGYTNAMCTRMQSTIPIPVVSALGLLGSAAADELSQEG